MDTSDGRHIPDVTALLLTTQSLEGFLTALAEMAVGLAPESDGCGITLERQRRPVTVTSVGDTAPRLDEKQYALDNGPCLEALRTGEEVAVADMLAERRWGAYPAYAAALGTHSSQSLPIAPHTHTAGALNLYAPQPHAFADADMTALRSLASQATGAIALAQRTADAQELAADLQAALQSRTVIDQAIGVLMAQQRCGPGSAFELLRAASQHRNVKLRDVCAELVARYGDPDHDQALRPRV
ncbi:GAF and ANTAR domain-containing protein [Streptomyces sp. NBC_01477]|uniref:GAF and ANTAR domain-containing protein n=1 Tax=Streptomyces sp. NBC_01477 TaxID=2976015 RepID=UPI002E2FDD90|nr:GAF and ANTAR domain-containing protein [Streptomyces sp. NBC_01477]